MQSELKKMYFFAMNNKNKINNNSIKQIEGKQKSIESLTKLLNYDNIVQKQEQNNSPNKISFIPKKKLSKQNKQRSVSCKIYPSPNNDNNQLLFPQVSKRVTKHRQKYQKLQKQKQENQNYEKYINDYLSKMTQKNLIENYENNHQKLIEQACRQIKKQIIRDKSIQSLSKSKSKQKIKKFQKKQYSLVENRSKSKLSNTIFDDNQRKKSQSLAQKNVYLLDLNRIQKKKQLGERQRRRTQKYFVRKLSKIALPPFHNLY